MRVGTRTILLGTLLCAASAALPAFDTGGDGMRLRFGATSAQAASATADEKQAFDSAKELGTVEAWDAFLNTYPSGFYSDLARAYVKKLGEAPQSRPATTPAAAYPPAEELACNVMSKLRSQSSKTPAKIVFVNAAGSVRSLVWLDDKGEVKPYRRLKPGEEVTQDTFLTHPWMVTDAAGKCSQIFMPAPGTTLALLNVEDSARPTRPASPPKSVPRAEAPAKPKTVVKKKTYQVSPEASCRELGLDYRNGQCVAKKASDKKRYEIQKKVGCPAGTYLNPLGKCQRNETGG